MVEGNILLISGVKGDTRRYRTLHAYEQLCLAGLPVNVSHITDSNIHNQIAHAGVVILHRVSSNPLVKRLVQTVKKQNGLVILDTDDYLYDPEVTRWIDSPDFSDPVRLRLYTKEIHRHKETLEYCQAIITSTDFLASTLQTFGKPVFVHRNAFSREMLHLSERAVLGKQCRAEKIVIGYASGTPTHNKDFEMVAPVLRSILARFEQTELMLVGPLDIGSGWEEVENRIRRFPLVPWRALPGLVAQFDVNLAPLVLDNPFSQSKSEIKYMEAALVQVPTVASPTDAFCYAIQPNINGFLAGGAEEWEDILVGLIENRELRTAVGLTANRKVIKEYHPVVRSEELVQTLERISQQLQSKPVILNDQDVSVKIIQNEKTIPVQPGLDRRFMEPTLLQMGMYSLRYRGLATLMGEFWVFLRRKLAFMFPFRSRSSSSGQDLE